MADDAPNGVSTTQHTMHSNAFEPSIPPELWFEIMRWATIIPGALDTTFASPFDTQATDTTFPNQYHDGMSMKKTLVIVSKTWRRIASPLLYETILMHHNNFPQLESMLLTAGDDEGLYCRHIRRLEARAPLVDLYLPNDLDPTNHFFIKLLKKCPILKIYKHRHHGSRTLSAELLVTLLECCGRSLRRLEIRGFDIPSNLSTLISVHTPHIQHLSCTMCIMRRSDDIPLVLPYLHTLGFDWMNVPHRRLAVLKDGEYPNLQCLAQGVFLDEDDEDEPPVLQTPPPPNLHVVDITHCRYIRLPLLLSSYPKIKTLIVAINFQLNAQDLLALDNAMTDSENILCRVGVHCIAYPAQFWSGSFIQNNFEKTFSTFANMKHFPHMQHIRVFGFQHSRDVMILPFWREWIPRLEVQGIRFDDENGERITLPADEERGVQEDVGGMLSRRGAGKGGFGAIRAWLGLR